jgi:hypothetical protein
MPKLFDRIIREGWRIGEYDAKTPGLRDKLDRLLGEAVIVEAPAAHDFVARHEKQHRTGPDDQYELKYALIFGPGNPEVETITAPYPVTWVEWEMGEDLVGCLVQQETVDADSVVIAQEGSDDVPVPAQGQPIRVHTWVFVAFPGKPIVAPYSEFGWMCAKETGHLMSYGDGRFCLSSYVPDELARNHPDYAADLSQMIMAPAYSLMAVFSLLNCTNVTLEPVPRTVDMQRRAERRFTTANPLPRYHTIMVRTTPKARPIPALRTPGEYKDVMPWHRVKNQYHRYGPEYGKGLLFGKYAGKFYVPAHTRGSKKNGIVISDYRIEDDKPKEP